MDQEVADLNLSTNGGLLNHNPNIEYRVKLLSKWYTLNTYRSYVLLIYFY